MVGDLLMTVGGHRERFCPKVGNKSLCKDSELGQLLMTCGKLSNKANCPTRPWQ